MLVVKFGKKFYFENLIYENNHNSKLVLLILQIEENSSALIQI